MDYRIAVFFLLLCLSTDYQLATVNDDANDDVLDNLQKPDNLKDCPEKVNCCCLLLSFVVKSFFVYLHLGRTRKILNE